jgi:predicted PurR-regulated permease PerM
VRERWAAALVASGAFAVVVATIAPFGWVLYRRRRELFDPIRSIPASVTVPLGEFSYTVDTSVVLDFLQSSVRGAAVTIASAAPVIALELFLFAILLYALLLRPGAAGRAVLAMVPDNYRDIPVVMNRRVRETLYGIYVLQAATAAGTFVIALFVFFGLGHRAAVTLAVVTGFLQFAPVVGPGVADRPPRGGRLRDRERKPGGPGGGARERPRGARAGRHRPATAGLPGRTSPD